MEREAQLNQAINDAFDPTGIDAFVGSLNQRNVRIASLIEASSDLTGFLPGAGFKPGGENFVTSFLTEFQLLDDFGRIRVEDRYRSSVESVSQVIKSKYPKVFR